MSLSLYDLVDDVMRGAPDTIRVFLEHKMGCVGCPIATFHTQVSCSWAHHSELHAQLAGPAGPRPAAGAIRPLR
jgi:hybrid cluster-associated redox disulfide protein